MSLPKLAIQRPVAVAMFFLGIVFLGVLSFVRLPIDLLPDVAYPRLVVYTTDPSAAPAEVERFITEPVEQAVSTVPGVQKVESVTREGYSLVSARFAWGTDMDFAALGTREKLDNIRDALPELAARPVVLRTDPRSEPILAVSVAGARDLPQLKELAEAVFRRRLEQIDGVAQASVTGGMEREIHVEVDPGVLEAHGLSIGDVSRALDEANASAPGGSIRRGRYRYSLRTLGELQTVADIAEVPVRRQGGAGAGGAGGAGGTGGTGGTGGSDAGASGAGQDALAGQLLVRDVARVEDGFRERESVARYNGRDAVGLLVFKNAGANTVRVTEEVEKVLAQLRREYPEVRLEVATSQAGFISDALSNVVQEVILGGILAFLVLFLFLREVRYPVAVALVIPISLIATFAMLQAAGVTLNIMSLGGLALGVGLLMDNSIVVLENIFRHRELGARAALAAAAGTEEVQRAIIASTLTNIAVFGPIVYVEGVAGQMLGALALSVSFSLLASIVVAVTLLPAMAARWGDGDDDREPRRGWLARRLARPLDAFDRGFAAVTAGYERLLEAGMRHRGRTMAVALTLLVAGLWILFLLPRSVLPEVDQGAYRARLELARGTPLETTAAAAARLERAIRSDPSVDAVFTRVGRQAAVAGMDERESGLNTATLDVRLKPGKPTDAALRRLRPALAGFPAGAVTLESGQATALGRLLGAGESDLSVRVRGEDLDAAMGYAAQVRQRLAGVPAVNNVRVGTELGQPEIRVEIDRERVAAYGMDAKHVAETVEGYMKGMEATQLVDFDRKVPVVVRLPEEARRSAETLERLTVDGVPLRELVRVHTASGPAEVRRVDQGRVVTVMADVAGGAGVDEAVDAVRSSLASLAPPPGIHVEIGGENEEMRRGFRDLALAFVLALALCYMLLAAEFESLLHPFIILLAVPLAAFGAAVALWIGGSGVNTMSLIGMVILVGIVDNDAVVKVDFINQMRRQGMDRHQAIRAAGHARFRPIVMNTVTAMLGLLPMALGIGAGGELQAPLAMAVFGGLLSATALTLVVIPVSYDLLEELQEWIVARLRGPAPEPVPAVPAPREWVDPEPEDSLVSHGR
jgi:HAE1 family hydrophobic/amphiphilic exporter-1